MHCELSILERRIRERFVKAFATYRLLEDGDHVLVGLSGGKDSLCLLEMLARRAKIDHPRFRVEALHVRMENIAYETSTDYLEHFCQELNVPLHIRTTSFSSTPTDDNSQFSAPNSQLSAQPEGALSQSEATERTANRSPLTVNGKPYTVNCKQIIYTGPLDQYFDYQYGPLDWRTVRFETKTINTPNYQGNAVVNYTSHEQPYTRIIEHKHFEMFGQAVYDCPKTVISEEYSTEYQPGMEQYYPVNDDKNNQLADKYRALAAKEPNVLFGGRLAEYKYYDMAPIIEKALFLAI